MRVLLTTDTVGGVWTYTRELTEGLLQRGCSIALVSFGRDPRPDQLAWATSLAGKYPESFCYVPSNVPLEWMEQNDRSFSDGAALLKQVAVSFKPDLLHTNQFCFGAVELGIPRIIVAHSDVLTWAAACQPNGLQPSSWLDQYIAGVQAGLSRAAALVTPTHWMLEALAKHFLLPGLRRVISNGKTIPQPDQEISREIQAVSAGRMWDPAKNLNALRSGEGVLPIMVAGDPPSDACPSPLEGHGLLQLGFLSQEELHELFRKSAIYIAASIYEPFGLAPLEAALCGCAIVANDIPSLREVWGDAATYFCDAAELRQRLQDLVCDDALLAERQRFSKLRAEVFTSEAMTTQYLELYAELVSDLRPERVKENGLLTYAG